MAERRYQTADRRERSQRDWTRKSEHADSRRPRPMRTKNGEPSTAVLGGYDCEFVDPTPESLQCPVCLLPFRDPHMLDCCGAKFCNVCIGKVKADRKPCPVCRRSTFNAMLDKSKQRKVLSLKVYCTRRSKGCDWVGELCCLDGHMSATCDWAEVPCRYCSQNVFRCRQTSHEQAECSQRLAKKMDSLKDAVASEIVTSKYELKKQVDKTINELRREMNKKFKEHEGDILELGREMDSKVYVMDHELKRKMDKLPHKAELKELRLEMDKARAEIRDLRKEIDILTTRIAVDASRRPIYIKPSHNDQLRRDVKLNAPRGKCCTCSQCFCRCFKTFILVALFVIVLVAATNFMISA